jgi:hypothetical protein
VHLNNSPAAHKTSVLQAALAWQSFACSTTAVCSQGSRVPVRMLDEQLLQTWASLLFSARLAFL